MKEKQVNATVYGEYLRKSTDDKEKQVLSLGSQRDVLNRLQQTHSLCIVETVEEKMSAKRPGRPGFATLIKLVKDGKIDGIVTWAPHRLSRNSVDIGEIINLFDTGYLKEIVTESHTYRNNPMDIFMLGFHCLQAKFENDNKALDVKGGMQRCAKIGIYPGCPPIGYLPDKYGIKGARKREIDPVSFPVVKKMWALMLMGTHTPYQILTKATVEWGLRSRTGKKLARSMIYKIFHNPFYYGEFQFPKGSGSWFKGIHTPMVTKAEFYKVQALMAKADNPRPSVHYFAFGGRTLRCGECGCAITGMAKIKKQKNGNVHQYVYYGCTKRRGACYQMPTTQTALSASIVEILTNIHIPVILHDVIMEWVRKENKHQFAGDYAQHDANKKALDVLKKKAAILIDMRASQLINDAEFNEQRADIETAKNDLLQLITQTEHKIENWLNIAEDLFTFAELAVTQFINGTPEVQRGILRGLGRNLFIIEKQLDIAKDNWTAPVIEIAKYIRSIIPPSEPVLSIYYKDKIENLLKSEILCTLLQELRNLFLNNH